MSAVATPSIRTRTAKTETTAKSAWLAERLTYLGATDISAIVGINPYSTPHDVWLQKKGLLTVKETIPMRAGTYMETFIAQEFSRENSVKCLRSKTYKHKEYPFLACNPDREIKWNGIDAILECKNVGHWAARNFGQDGSDQIPEHYMIQIMWQLLITGKDLVVLAALIDDRELRTYFYSFNPEYSEWAHIFDKEAGRKLFNHAIGWWNRHILGDVEPELTGADSDTEYVKRERDSYDNGKLTNTDEATDRLCVRLKSALVRESRAKLVANERKNRIKQFMASQGASSLESSVGIFSWKTNARGVATFNTPFRTGKA